MDREAIVCASAEKARAAPPPAVLLRATPTRESTLAPSTWDCYSTALQVIRSRETEHSATNDFADTLQLLEHASTVLTASVTIITERRTRRLW
mmetsp:Transcript_3954/g.9158  ORF Transcript_3954/g.9158 Transcript_3954/m.9158 type:complete len:93 (-) Transcript_3954:34-312(-)